MKKKFTLLTVVSLSLFALAACSTTTPTKKESSDAKTEQKSEEVTEAPKETTYKVGDTIVFDGYAEITITGAEWTDERNQFEADFLETVPEKVLKVTYNITNLSDKDYFVGSDIELYVAGKKMESYPNTNTMDTVSAGRAYEGAIQHFGVIGSGAIELELEPSIAFDTEPAIVKLDIQ